MHGQEDLGKEIKRRSMMVLKTKVVNLVIITQKKKKLKFPQRIYIKRKRNRIEDFTSDHSAA
jgi:hypothetical protein